MTNQTNLLLAEFSIGDHVECAPHFDCWMRGDRFGEVVSIGRFYVHVRMSRSGTMRKFSPENLKLK